MSLTSCPPEILTLIFTAACADGGCTGRALSLVSKRIRAVSRRCALFSVALYGSYQISAFADYLENVKLEDRRVVHLFCTDRPRIWLERPPSHNVFEWARERIAVEIDAMDPTRDSECSAEPFKRILRIVSPTLRHLAILLFDRYNEHSLASSFPVLEELTLCGSLFHHSNEHFESPHCPKLRRVHLIQDSAVRKRLVQVLSVVAPSATHIRLSRIPGQLFDSQDVVNALRRMVDQETSSSSNFPPTLERVILQFSDATPFHQPTRRDRQSPQLPPLVQKTKEIAARDKHGRIILLKSTSSNPMDYLANCDPDAEYYKEIRDAWLQRVSGSEGIWEVDRSDILTTYGHSPSSDSSEACS